MLTLITFKYFSRTNIYIILGRGVNGIIRFQHCYMENKTVIIPSISKITNWNILLTCRLNFQGCSIFSRPSKQNQYSKYQQTQPCILKPKILSKQLPVFVRGSKNRPIASRSDKAYLQIWYTRTRLDPTSQPASQ